MSFRNVQQNNIAGKDFSAPAKGPWVRNPSWPALAAPLSSEEKFVGLYAVWPGGGNFAAVLFTTSTGQYTVNWGDGTSVNTNSNIQTNYEYSYSNANLVGTEAPVTLNATTDRVERNAHGYRDGDTVRLYNIATTTGVSNNTLYYVINSTANDFQVSATPFGSAIDLVGNGTAQLLPYRIATVTVTPATGGATLNNVDIARLHNQTGLQTGYANGWLEIKLSHGGTPGGGGFVISSSSSQSAWLENFEIIKTRATTQLVAMFSQNTRNLRRLILNDASTVTSFSSLCQSCPNLTDVVIGTTGIITTTSSMFSGCSSLVNAPFFNTGSVTDMTSMFANCPSLKTVPLYNTASVILMTTMFSGCSSLTSVPLFNTASVTNMATMFGSCVSLTTVPLFNTALVTTMASMFSGCSSLTSVPLFNTASVTNMATMFSTCLSLITIPQFNTASVTNMASMFSGCSSLVTIPLLNMSLNQFANTLFTNCQALESVPPLNLPAVTTIASMFNNCTALREIPAINFNNATTVTTPFNNCRLSRIQATGIKLTHSIANNMLSAAALDEYYTGLPTVTSQTLTVTGNYGITGDNPAIATAKGWTVTGS